MTFGFVMGFENDGVALITTRLNPHLSEAKGRLLTTLCQQTTTGRTKKIKKFLPALDNNDLCAAIRLY